MTAKPLRCGCCGMVAGELSNGVCIDCAEGNHQVHCGKAVGEKSAAKTTSAPAEAPKTTATATAEPPAPEPPKPENGEQKALVPVGQTPPPAKRTIEAGDRGLILSSIEDMYRFATAVVRSGLAPKGLETPEAVLVAIQFGAEVGLSPMQALQNVANVNGRPSLFGDAPKGIIDASGLMEEFDEWYEHDGARVDSWPAQPKEDTAALCSSKRVGRTAIVTRFTFADAKRAGLWGKAGPWTQYPGRMMKARARGFNLRDNFPDKLKGFRDSTEAADIIDVTPDTERVTLQMPKRASESGAVPETPAS